MHFPRTFTRLGFQHNSNVIILGLMMLFWSVFDGTVTYTTPIVITQAGYSEAVMGIIVGSSSIAGALFDFVLCNVLRRVVYRRVFLVMFSLCALYPFILLNAGTMAMFVLAMAVWGLYYDLKNFGIFNYVGHYTHKTTHAASFGVIHVFAALGYFFAPLLVGAIIGESVDWQPYVMAYVFLAMAVLFLITLTMITRHNAPEAAENRPQPVVGSNVFREVRAWSKLARYIYPFLGVTLLLSLVDGFTWTIGPLFAEDLAVTHSFAGFLMAAFTLPPLFVGWMVAPLIKRLGKRTASYVTLILGFLLISLVTFVSSPLTVILLFFFSSVCMALTWPTVSGMYADHISRHEDYEKEIEGLEDFFTNLGYIIGPMLAGFLAQYVGHSNSFTVLGVVGAVSGFIILHAGRKERHLPHTLTPQQVPTSPAYILK